MKKCTNVIEFKQIAPQVDIFAPIAKGAVVVLHRKFGEKEFHSPITRTNVSAYYYKKDMLYAEIKTMLLQMHSFFIKHIRFSEHMSDEKLNALHLALKHINTLNYNGIHQTFLVKMDDIIYFFKKVTPGPKSEFYADWTAKLAALKKYTPSFSQSIENQAISHTVKSAT